MNIGIIGTSRITSDHIKVLKEHRHKIIFLSSTRKKSKNLRQLSRKHKIKKTFSDWRQSINFAKKDKKCNFLITSRIEDNLKILKSCIKLNRFIFIEKPVFLKSRNFNYFKNNKKVFVGYNRIFYKNINYLKKIFTKKRNINVIVKCPELNRKNILKNSCHIISILTFIFGKLKLNIARKGKNYINCILENKQKCFCYLSFNLNNSDNFSIEIFDKRKKFILSPIEKLKIYKSIKVQKYKNNFIYNPKLFHLINEYNENKFKPGFDNQMKTFLKFTKGKKIINDLEFSKQIMQICERIAK